MCVTAAGTPAAAITKTGDVTDALTWYRGALGEIHAMPGARGLATDAPTGGIFGNAVFAHDHGPATAVVPCFGPLRPMGRATAFVVPRPLPAPHVMGEGTQGVVRGARHCASLTGAECLGRICRPPVDDSVGS
jgi:hypothetical protein